MGRGECFAACLVATLFRWCCINVSIPGLWLCVVSFAGFFFQEVAQDRKPPYSHIAHTPPIHLCHVLRTWWSSIVAYAT
jgi:hypothetical protein